LGLWGENRNAHHEPISGQWKNKGGRSNTNRFGSWDEQKAIVPFQTNTGIVGKTKGQADSAGTLKE